MKILICDDEYTNLEILKKHIMEYTAAHCIKADIYATTSPKEIFESSTSYDLAFLDIQMPDIDGISVAKELKNRNQKVVIFFVTAFDEYQDEAMDLHAFRFFDKPLNIERLYSGLNRAIEYLNESYIDVYIENKNRHIKVSVDDIKYIKRENRKNTVVTNNEIYTVRCKFDELISALPNTFFYLVHKSFYVNLHYITEYSYKEIYIDDTRISVATRKQADFHKYWFNYVKRR
jgi:two-component system LytT family response regulator